VIGVGFVMQGIKSAPYLDMAKDICAWKRPPTGYRKSNTHPYLQISIALQLFLKWNFIQTNFVFLPKQILVNKKSLGILF
jgi:hypothetical protein